MKVPYKPKPKKHSSHAQTQRTTNITRSPERQGVDFYRALRLRPSFSLSFYLVFSFSRLFQLLYLVLSLFLAFCGCSIFLSRVTYFCVFFSRGLSLSFFLSRFLHFCLSLPLVFLCLLSLSLSPYTVYIRYMGVDPNYGPFGVCIIVYSL